MTQKAAILKALLQGKTLSIKNGFDWFSCTNIPREIGRSVEREFNVRCERTRKEKISRYGQPCCWYEYKLPKTKENEDGIKKIIEYIREQEGYPKTDTRQKEAKKINQLSLL